MLRALVAAKGSEVQCGRRVPYPAALDSVLRASLRLTSLFSFSYLHLYVSPVKEETMRKKNETACV
ncbi:hypothetical protein DVH24_042531 [Malus domestica]|uniref:Uncharacterized protein n=1 Tax=Malus domestica TaxID=3750 RepID=A0A498JD55_MALDO|nr:hypothetical protein DVH24_042531 [Malus domestica]